VLERLRRGRVRREEQLDRQLGGRHLERRLERGEHAVERQLAAVGSAHPQRPDRLADGSAVTGADICGDLPDHRGELLVCGDRSLAFDPVAEVGVPLARVDEQRAESPRVHPEPQHVDRRREQRRVDVDAVGQHRHRRVGGDEVPVAVDDDRRVGLVAAEDQVERLTHRRELGGVQRALRKRRGVARGQQQLVALPERHLQLLGDPQQHVAPGLRSPGLDEAEMPRRDPRVERQLELGHAPPRAPFAQQRPDLVVGPRGRHSRGRLYPPWVRRSITPR